MNLSPFLAHQAVHQKMTPRLSYAGQPFGPWRDQVKQKLIELIGLPQIIPPAPATTSIWKRDTPLGTIEKLAFPAEPGADIVAYWCVPHGARKPYPTFICLQGHSSGMHVSIGVGLEDETQPIDAPGDRDFAIGCMKRGIAALCVEQRGFGYRREFHLPNHRTGETTCHDPQIGAMMIGRTLVGERVWDVDRAIDWLEARGDADLSTLGVMGNSTGGTISMYASAVLDRVKCCIASCCFARFADSIAGRFHCCCNIVPGIMNWLDMADIIGAAAPRAMVVVNGVTDDIFPIESARSHIERAKRAYAAAGAGDRIKFVEGPEGHRFYADPAWNALLPMIA